MVQEKHGILPLRLDSWFKLQVIELGFRANLNKILCLVCVWVMTHIRIVLGINHEKFLKKDM